ncbi:hypothetical protein BDV59DRAFT_166350 [Aspergillus ambiguus]|uniref:uncharacterized protein n=1 Tax=Aspergillus ambiguus TaxID=176160 RepID=UPI003CCC959F
MPPKSQSPSLASLLVARFLRSNNYKETLTAFIREAELPVDAGQVTGKDDWTIEGVLEEKKAFDETIRFERYCEDEHGNDLWSTPAPSKPSIIQTPSASNLLSCSVEPWQQISDGAREETPSYVVATGADRQLHLFETATGNDAVHSFSGHSESPILSYVALQNGKYVFLTNMSGQILLQRGREILDRRKDHTKYAVKVVAYETQDADSTVWIATAGWDSKVFLYRLRLMSDDSVNIGDPVAYITLASNPESLLFVQHPDTKQPILLVARRDSTYLFYYQVENAVTSSPQECALLGRQNLAPHSNAWVAFSPSCLALSPHDPGLLAVATSTLPHMKVLIVRMLFPTPESLNLVTSGPVDTAAAAETQATQALAALSLQNTEDAAILIQANTFAPQTAYSTPQVVWRPDGSGVWVNGDDGVIRGVEAKTGKVTSLLKDGHQVGCKVRTIWAGWVPVRRGDEVVREEWLVSGGFDKRLIVWREA